MIQSILLQAADGAGGGMGSLIMFGALLLVMYFFFFRPQMKKQKEETKFQDEISKGVRIVTSSGIHGKILEVQEKTLVIESENSRLKIEKSAVSKELSAQYNVAVSGKKKEKDSDK
jgi:preprotein translocase subunit YajC